METRFHTFAVMVESTDTIDDLRLDTCGVIARATYGGLRTALLKQHTYLVLQALIAAV